MKYVTVFLLLMLLIACQPEKRKPIYQSDAFTLYPDRVVQGDNEAIAISPRHLTSNYKSPASETYSRLVTFKFSINEKDNELPPGKDHWLIIGEEHQSPVLRFGKLPEAVPEAPDTYLPVNYEYTFRVDMSPVLEQFEEKGYYEAFDGSRVAKADFKGFYIAGGSEPLTWDFVNLEEQGLQLQGSEGDSIYEITLKLNPYNPEDYRDKEWKLTESLSGRPQYRSDQPIVDALFNLSLEEAILAIEPDSTLRTGAKWGGVWTRDISYSIFLAFAYHEPEVAKISLMKKVKRDRIIQDTGSGGAWPVSSDRTTWALAAWEIYKTTGDMEWLRKAFTIIRNSLEDDYKVLKSPHTGMYRGESSFLDWREQTYPKWMSNMDIYVSENLGTNVVHYQAHRILAKMAKILGESHEVYEKRAEEIKTGINDYLWMSDKGYYGQYLYGRQYLNLSPRFEALGEALAILFEVADEEQAQFIISKSPVVDFGVTCIYPQIPGIPPYHNNGIWPFVQSYWNLAAAKAGNEKVLNHGLAAIYRAGGLFLTNYENFVAGTGDFLGTEINSHRMLWSMAGNLAMVHRVFMGMSFEVDGLRFHPVIPSTYPGTKSLSNFHYRDAVLDITVEGFGNRIESITLDGEPLEEAFLPAGASGKHSIYIVMKNQPFEGSDINLVDNHFSLPNPQVQKDGPSLSWEAVPGAVEYLIYKDGELLEKTTTSPLVVPTEKVAEYKISALDNMGYESFTSEPLRIAPEKAIRIIEVEQFTGASGLPYTNYSGRGFVEISNEKNRSIEMLIDMEEAGDYLIDFRYSNGSGPWNTDNKCAIRDLYANGGRVGPLVFPQRGTDEWSDWGYSNSYVVKLNKGSNTLRLSFEPWDVNMNVEVNRAMVDFVRLIQL
ncbi:MAG: hypothetical protein KDD06_08880 [Phaeodactylibacter sp.]|nr:hypothetical protein [Phaeodactylibacter sp.]MCB9264908.1 glycogen debranching protein [Lewinellaceae bacterium]MCB9291060.1 glycogen debranching protein [Lewinellaceae bacterium]